MERFGDEARFSVTSLPPSAEPAPPPRLAGMMLKILVASLVAMAIILYLTLSRRGGDGRAAPGADAAAPAAA